jgi:hypothetical protein
MPGPRVTSTVSSQSFLLATIPDPWPAARDPGALKRGSRATGEARNACYWGICQVLLLVFPLSAVFFASGTIMLGLAGLAQYIPRRLGRDRLLH